MRNKKIDESMYGRQEYMYDVVFKNNCTQFVYDKNTYTLSKGLNRVRAVADVIDYPMDTLEYENEIYNDFLDSFKGTNWNNIKQIDI